MLLWKPVIAALLSTVLISGLPILGVRAEPAWRETNPGTAWHDGLKAAQDYVATAKPTAMMIVHEGRLIGSWGDIRRKVNVASVRKSLLGALYGIAVSEGRIDLASTLADLGIDDKPPTLSAAEKKATVRDLLASRSGVYHPAAYETADMKQDRPARGSHPPGAYWWYNNWDFNVLGTIYRRRTGEDIFESFARRVAAPIGMEDFSPRDGSYVTEPASIHPAYLLRLNARDATRFGLLFLNNGQWNGRQIVPSGWIKESTATVSQISGGHHNYGYMWWTLPPDVFGPGAAYASGIGGQVIAIVPSRQLVAVQLYDTLDRGHTQPFIDLVRQLTIAAP